MNLPLRLGYKASAEQFGPRELLDFSVLAEELGFDSVFISDHFQPWKHTDGHAPLLLRLAWGPGRQNAAGADRDERGDPDLPLPSLRGGPGDGHPRRHVPERVILGIGTGESLNEVPATAMKWPAFKERQGRFRESIKLMRQLWREERVTFSGQYYQTENATIYDRPDDPIPVYIAASGPSAAKLGGEMGDGFICTSGKAPELYRETLIPKVDEGLKQAARPNTIDRMIEMKVSFATDKRQAMEDTREWAALALSADEKMSVEDPMQMEALANALPIERAASRWIVSTDVDEHIERIRPYVELGFRHLVFHAPGKDQERFLRLYAKDVLPRLRATFG